MGRAAGDAARRVAFKLSFRLQDGWPLAVTWELQEAYSSDAHVSVFAATLDEDRQGDARPPA